MAVLNILAVIAVAFIAICFVILFGVMLITVSLDMYDELRERFDKSRTR